MSISEWSTTPADNASAATGINWAEGQAPSTVNDSARQMMADVAAWYAQLVGAGMLFAQAAAPTGWTKDSTTYDHALRLTSGTGGATAGTEDFSTVFAITATDTHALTEAELPSHTHTITISDSGHTHSVTDPGHAHTYERIAGTGVLQLSGAGLFSNTNTSFNTGSNTTGISIQSHTAGITASASNTGSGTAHSHDINLKVKYYDLIRCTKDA